MKDATLGRQHLDGAKGARRRRRIRVGQYADGEEGGGLGHRERAVEIAVDLWLGAGEVEAEPFPLDCRRDPQANVAGLAARVVLQHVLGGVRSVRKAGERGARAALRVVEDLRHPGAQDADPVLAGELEQAPLAGEVGGPLGAEVGEPLHRVAHLVRQPRELLVRGAGRGDHHALVLQALGVGRHARRGRATHVGVMGAAGGEPEQLASLLAAGRGEDRRDQGDVREVGPSSVGIVEDPQVAGVLLGVQDRRDRVRHGSEVDGNVLGLHHQLARGVEERRRAVAPFLDVGGIRGAHEHRPHLLAGGSKGADQHLERDRVEPRARFLATRRPWSQFVASMVP